MAEVAVPLVEPVLALQLDQEEAAVEEEVAAAEAEEVAVMVATVSVSPQDHFVLENE